MPTRPLGCDCLRLLITLNSTAYFAVINRINPNRNDCFWIYERYSRRNTNVSAFSWCRYFLLHALLTTMTWDLLVRLFIRRPASCTTPTLLSKEWRTWARTNQKPWVLSKLSGVNNQIRKWYNLIITRFVFNPFLLYFIGSKLAIKVCLDNT